MVLFYLMGEETEAQKDCNSWVGWTAVVKSPNRSDTIEVYFLLLSLQDRFQVSGKLSSMW